MEDIVGLVIVFLIYLVFGGKSKKKKEEAKARREKRLAERARKSDFHTAFTDPQDHVQQRSDAVRPAAAQRPETRMPMHAQEGRPCEERPIHLHEVTPWQMDEAGEGEDPCHQGGLQSGGHADETEESEVFEAAYEHTAQDQRAQELLRGMIMSEVLTRPAQRKMMRGGRRRR